MFITPSFKKSLIVEQFQGNYLKCLLSSIVENTIIPLEENDNLMSEVFG